MTSFRRMALVFALALGLIGLFAGCKGDTGPAGPQGIQGDQGPQGDKGDPGEPGGGGTIRTVMSGVVPDESLYSIDIDGVTLADPPLISVFIDIEGVDAYDELPVSYDDGTGQEIPAYASLREGGVDLWNCNGFKYILIIID